MTLPTIRVARLVPATPAEGPGLRSALWVQGCSLRCPGCFNPQTWPARGGEIRSVADVLQEMMSDPRIEGVTLLGGEPFEQAPALAHLAESLQEHGLGVITFTGYTLEELERREDVAMARLLAATDLLVDGPYLRDLPDAERPLVGSRNQRFHPLTPRYGGWLGGLTDEPDRLNIQIGRDGSVEVTGWAPDTLRVELLSALNVSRIRARKASPRSDEPGPEG